MVQAQPVYDTDVEPPPPQFEQISDRPGYVWIDGHWGYVGSNWQWQPGHYEVQRPGYAYRPGRWQRQGNRWHYNEGRWEEGNAEPRNVIIRDHRGQPQQPEPYQPPPGTVVVPSRTNP